MEVDQEIGSERSGTQFLNSRLLVTFPISAVGRGGWNVEVGAALGAGLHRAGLLNGESGRFPAFFARRFDRLAGLCVLSSSFQFIEMVF